MDIPLEIAFHNMKSSASLEAEIRDRVDKLERVCGQLVGCRVTLEGNSHAGNPVEVHIDMKVPGAELVINKVPRRAAERRARTDTRASLRDAFHAAEMRLKEYRSRQTGHVKPHDQAFRGEVALLEPEADHGFLLTNEGTQLYFHRNAVMDGALEAMRRGDTVHYVAIDGDTGPIASKVWVGSGSS